MTLAAIQKTAFEILWNHHMTHQRRKDGAMLSSQTSAKASFIYIVIVYLGM